MSTFHTRYDRWLIAVLLGGVGISISGLISAWAASGPWVALGAAAPSLILMAGVGWLLAAMDYTIAPPDLVVRAGPMRWRIPIQSIQSVTPTRNPLSSPACSLDRLRIDYLTEAGRARSIMISPINKLEFLEALGTADADLLLQADRLARQTRA